VRPVFDGLLIDPCIPSTMKGFTVTRHFRGADYHITVDNSAGVEKGIKSITVDGKLLNGEALTSAVLTSAVLPAFGDGKNHQVNVVMGNK
jgi:cellobiose phosphorylase